MFDWISQYSTNFSWISCRETEVFGAKTVLTPGRCHQGRKSHQRVRGWQGVHEFQEITLDIIDIIIGTYRKAAPHETTRVWILYVGVFLLPGSFQHLFLTRVVSTTYFLLKTRAHEIQQSEHFRCILLFHDFDIPFVYLTVRHGKSPFLRTVNHLFLWAMYTMAMLVITRGYPINHIP